MFILTNIADPDEMLHFVAFHLGLLCSLLTLLVSVYRSIPIGHNGTIQEPCVWIVYVMEF